MAGTNTKHLCVPHEEKIGPMRLVQRKSELTNKSLKEVIALGLAKSAALGTFPTETERAVDLYDQGPPIWYRNYSRTRS
jgi:hypothetical protein